MEEIKLYHKVWYYQRSKRSVLDMELVFTTAVRCDLSLGSFRSHS